MSNTIAKRYADQYKTAKVPAKHESTVVWYTQKIHAGKNRYQAVSCMTGCRVPWWVIGVLHALECSCDFSKHLHNGDPLARKTVQVPKGRPLKWTSKGTWEESALDALQYDGLTKVTDWTIGNALAVLEAYNGLGYRKKGVPSPYLWSFTQHYTSGKYVADGKYSGTAVSKQPGVAALMLGLGVK